MALDDYLYHLTLHISMGKVYPEKGAMCATLTVLIIIR